MKKSDLTKEEKKAIRLYKTHSTKEAARKAGIEYERLRVIITSLSIHRENFYWTKEQDEILLKEFGKTKTKELVKKLKKTKWAIYHRMKKLNKD